MASDPRQRREPAGSGSSSILLAHHEDDDVMDVDEVAPPQQPLASSQTATTAAAATAGSSTHYMLPTRIVTPSPFPQHAAANSRFRNALTRVNADPVHDAEAWQAVLTEVAACYKSIVPSSAAAAGGGGSGSSGSTQQQQQQQQPLLPPDQLFPKLDWVESCYGTVLHHFPYAVRQIHDVGQILLHQCSAMPQQAAASTRNNPVVAAALAQRAAAANAKLTHLLRTHLGVYSEEEDSKNTEDGKDETTISEDADSAAPDNNHQHHHNKGSNTATTTTPHLPLCTWSVDLWRLYIQKVRLVDTAGSENNRPAVTDAYERAVSAAGAVHHDNHRLWQSYLRYVEGDAYDATAEPQHRMLHLRRVYQRCLTHPMAGLESLWQNYEAFEKEQSEALAAQLLQDLGPKYQHAKTVYLERNRVVATTERLQLGRLATPPVGEARDNITTSTAAATTRTAATAGGGDSAATAAGNINADDDYGDLHDQYADEYQLLAAWRVRCAYERTNPARLTTAELATSVRLAYQEMACTLTRHPEPWHMWSTWELQQQSAKTGTTNDKAENDNSKNDNESAPPVLPASVQRAVQVLQLGQRHIPDSALLAWAEAVLVERHSSSSTKLTQQQQPQQQQQAACVAVLERLVQRRPNTLGYVLYQQLVRRYHGKAAARAVFAQARRVLRSTDSDAATRRTTEAKTAVKDDPAAADGGEGAGEAADAAGVDKEENGGGNRWMVTNRLDARIGNANESMKNSVATNGAVKKAVSTDTVATPMVLAGPITWHLYAAHAVMEHRSNRAPEVAARVYELGLRKHASFLTVPAYIQRYAQLLLELNDTKNLKALLTRAVAACQQQQQQQGKKKEALAALWDMTLQFESIIGADDPACISTLLEIERKRREAVLGPDVEDVATGGLVGSDGAPLIGAQKSTISEQLVRAEGYEVSSRIVNGMSRTVDLLSLMGLWGTGEQLSQISSGSPKTKEDTAELSGGKSDISFQKRLRFQQMAQAGISPEAAAADGGGGGSKIHSARERLAGGAGGPAGPGGGGGTAIMLAIQQSPDWLRPLLLLLPASRLRLPIVAKPPPHLTEMALSTLRQNTLPAERPADDVTRSNKRSRSAPTDGNSSDEDNGVISGSSGYGNTFRARQRARMQQNGTAHLS